MMLTQYVLNKGSEENEDDAIDGKSNGRMVASGKNLIISSSDRVSRSDFSVGKCSAKGNKTTHNPADEKHIRGNGCTSRIRGSPEYPHPNHQTNNDHGDVEQIE